MISKERFQELEYKYGCGYWNVCWEHACPCAIITEDKGYSEEIYNALVAESKRVADMYEDDNNSFDYENNYTLPCGCCACCGCSCDDELDYEDDEL